MYARIEAADAAITEFVERHRGRKDNGLPEMKFTWNFEEERWKLFGELSEQEKVTIHYGLRGKLLHTTPYKPSKGIRCRAWNVDDEVIVLINEEFYYGLEDFDMTQAHTVYSKKRDS